MLIWWHFDQSVPIHGCGKVTFSITDVSLCGYFSPWHLQPEPPLLFSFSCSQNKLQLTSEESRRFLMGSSLFSSCISSTMWTSPSNSTDLWSIPLSEKTKSSVIYSKQIKNSQNIPLTKYFHFFFCKTFFMLKTERMNTNKTWSGCVKKSLHIGLKFLDFILVMLVIMPS